MAFTRFLRLLFPIQIFLLPSPSLATYALSTADQLTIINQLNLHQTYIDNDSSYASAALWLSLYWPDAIFTANDKFGSTTWYGADPKNDSSLKQAYDFDHSVFPLNDWFHNVDVYQFVDLDPFTPMTDTTPSTSTTAKVHWRWRVNWKVNTTGVVSTGTYDDVFEKRGGVWKCKSRVSNIDANWPDWLFRPYFETRDARFKASKP
ncbi:MAG: hypothetical protein Q9160_006736 [Pyrenula sp. 1 TL-2023]